MPIVVFANRKGGVGKTVSTLYTGRWLARAGQDVTLVDLDPQQGLWDIASLLGLSNGVFTKRLRLAPDGVVPPSRPDCWTLVDTPPALEGNLPVLAQADYLVIPVIPEGQEVAQLTKFLRALRETQPQHPQLCTLGILPVRYVRQWEINQASLATIHQIGAAHGIPVLEPVPWSKAVGRYSLAGGLWRPLAQRLLAQELVAANAHAA